VHTHTWPAVTGDVAQTTGSTTTNNLAKFDASGRLVDAGIMPLNAYFDAGALTVDGTNCTNPTSQTIGSGPKVIAFSCADSNNSVFDGAVALPQSLATVTFQLSVSDVDSLSQHFAGNFKAMCRAAPTVINSTWGTAINVDITMVTADAIYQNNPVTVTPNGTCSSGAILFFRFTMDATTNTDDGDARVLGVLMRQGS
jgi:hypothetical protein